VKILIILGSPRKGNTYRACTRIEEVMKTYGDVVFEYLMLKDADLAQCTGCFVCFLKGEEHCPRKDDAPGIEQKMHDADGVIFASPVYGMNVSGLTKVFVDRFSYIFHRPRFFEKKALLITTTGAIGHKDVLKYLDMVARIWGFEVVDRVGLITPPGDLPQNLLKEYNDRLSAAAKKFSDAITSKRRSSPRLMDVIVFNAQRVSFSDLKDEGPLRIKSTGRNTDGWIRGRDISSMYR
jgi:multimeric flavodoxin WrbA